MFKFGFRKTNYSNLGLETQIKTMTITKLQYVKSRKHIDPNKTKKYVGPLARNKKKQGGKCHSNPGLKFYKGV